MVDEGKSANQDARVLQLYEELLEIEQRLIPTGLHVLGRPSVANEKADLLKMIAAFDRPEFGARALANTVADGLGLTKTENRDPEQREQIDRIIDAAIRELLENGIDSATELVSREAGVSAVQVRPTFVLLADISKSLETI